MPSWPSSSQRIRGVLVHDDALYKSTFYLLTYLLLGGVCCSANATLSFCVFARIRDDICVYMAAVSIRIFQPIPSDGTSFVISKCRLLVLSSASVAIGHALTVPVHSLCQY